MTNQILKSLAVIAATAVPTVSLAQMPGMQGTQHIGITVPNLDEAVSFFVDVLGCEEHFSIGPFGPFEDDWMNVNLNVNPRAVINKATLVRCGNGPAMEVFDYSSPDQETVTPRNSDVGGHHIAFYVDDIDVATEYLEAQGVQVLGPPHDINEGGFAGLRWNYFISPWGLQMEIVSHPDGLGDESTAGLNLWDPRD